MERMRAKENSSKFIRKIPISAGKIWPKKISVNLFLLGIKDYSVAWIKLGVRFNSTSAFNAFRTGTSNSYQI